MKAFLHSYIPTGARCAWRKPVRTLPAVIGLACAGLSAPCWTASADSGSAAQIGMGNPVVVMALTALITTLVFLLLDWRQKHLRTIIFSSIPSQVFAFSGKGQVLFSQLNTAEGTAWANGIRSLDDLPAAIRDAFRDKILAVLAAGTAMTHEFTISGRQYRVTMQKLPRRVLGDDCVLCVFADIDELHHERQRGAALTDRFAATLEAIGDAVLATDKDGAVTLANTVCCQLLGLCTDEIIGRPYMDVLPLLDANKHQPLVHPIQSALRQEHDIRRYSHFRLQTRDGRQLQITGTAAPIYDSSQQLNGAVMAFRDDTDDFHQRSQLNVQNSFLQAAAAVAEMSYFHSDGGGTMLADVSSDFWGRRSDGTVLPVEEWVHPEDQAAFKNAWQGIHSGGSDCIALTFRNQDRLSSRYFELKANAMCNAVSGEREIIGYIRDVTNLRRNEQLNYDTMLLLQEIIDNLPCYISVSNINDQFSHVLSNTMHQSLPDSARLANIAGDKDTLALQAILAALRDDDRNAASMDEPSEKVAPFVGHDFAIHQGKFFRKVLTRANGEKMLLGLVFDISDEIARETQLQETNTLFQAVLDTLPCVLFVKDFYDEDRFIISNRYYHRLLGLPDGAMIGKNNYDFFPKLHADKYTDDDGTVMSSGKELEVIEELPCVAGKVITAHAVKTRIHRQSGHDLLLGICFDVTELHDSRNQLREVNGVLTGILENLPAIIAAKNANDDYRYVAWNKAAETLYGLSAKDIIGHTDTEIAVFKPLAEKYRQEELLLAKTGSIRKSQQLRAPDGSEHELTVEIRQVQTQNTSLVLVMGFDVTEEKRRELERIKLSEQLETYVEQERLFNSCLESIILSDDDDVALQNVQRTIAKWIGANRCCIFQFDRPNSRIRPVIEWTAPAIIGQAKPFAEMPMPKANPWFEHFNEEPLQLVSDVAANEFNPILKAWREILRSTGVKSICRMALSTRDELWGFVGFAFPEQRNSLSPEDQQMLLSAAHIIEIILERRHSREKLSRSEYEKRLILDTIQIPILLFNADHQLLRVNNAGIKVAGVDEELLYSDPCFLNFCSKHERPQDCPLALTIADRQTHNKEVRVKDRDFLITSHPIFIEKELVYILETMVDISEAKVVQHKLQQALLEAQNANKAKSYFLANVSHELRTPLNAVIGFSELLRGSEMTITERNEYLESINLAGKALLNLINDVLDLSKIEADQMVIVPQPTEIPSLAQEILAIFKHRTNEKGLRFKIDYSAEIPILLLDTLRLRQILLNLVGNAIKFTDHGSITVGISFKPLDSQKGTLNIIVADTGCGIRPEYRKRIFQPFEQQDSVRDSTIYHGSGLGLAISRRLVLRMGGSIDVVSEVGKGSEFQVTLHDVPYTTLYPADSDIPGKVLPQRSSADASRGQAAPKSARRSYQHLRVLIADDVPMNLQVLSAMLKKMGVTAMTAANGRDVLHLLSNGQVPEVLLTDMWMPDMNGSQLAERIREQDRFRAMRIVAVTADAEVRSSFDMKHFDNVLLKPITFDKLDELFSSL
ncbi:PAS domain-containing protein [Oligosphaera ethanolica]|uniref:histidine kinase n=1 Tax=Oligosphaera ethanolica TaxID=760260 RepID=A0AAE4APP3_9BACT|nr:PAS domain-containing protein [Oligosphaera ethanolica]MDQ0289632.1 PAS domain S-box-containing protein [Oligosphaera ethanolica]